MNVFFVFMEDYLPPKYENGVLRKSACGRTNLFLKSLSTIYREVRCSASTVARQASSSIFHNHSGNSEFKKPPNCVCWHCCHPFQEEGFRLPRLYDPAENVYHVYGWFCSANCAKAYILEHSTFDRGYQMNIFVRMLRDIYSIDRGVVEAPPRISLQMFGGPFDIESFRSEKNICLVIAPPFVSHSMLIEERVPNKTMGETSAVKENDTFGHPNLKGSVRGLRRPVETPLLENQDEQIYCPSEDGLYETFIANKKVENEVSCNTKTATSSAQGKRQKILKTGSASTPKEGIGLAKFACS